MIQVQKDMPRQRQGQSKVQSWWDDYRPDIQSLLSHKKDVASFTVIAGMIRYPAESCSLVQNIKASDFTSNLTKQLGKSCLFELNGYGRVRAEVLFDNLVSDSWNQIVVKMYEGMIYQIPFHVDLEIVEEVICGAVKELKHERFCTNRQF